MLNNASTLANVAVHGSSTAFTSDGDLSQLMRRRLERPVLGRPFRRKGGREGAETATRLTRLKMPRRGKDRSVAVISQKGKTALETPALL